MLKLLYGFLNFLLGKEQEGTPDIIEWGSPRHAEISYAKLCYMMERDYGEDPSHVFLIESLGFGVWGMNVPHIGYLEQDLSCVESFQRGFKHVERQMKDVEYTFSKDAVWC